MTISTSRIRRAVPEFLLIVAGVLTALTVDAWWQGHVDRVREQEYLEQLLADVRDNRRRLEAALHIEVDQMQRATTMLSAVRGPTAIRADSAESWLTRTPPFPWYSDPRLVDGTMVALIETGDINLIRDTRIRTATIAYASQLRADMEEFSREITAFQQYASRIYTLMELSRTADLDPNDDAPVRALSALRGNAEAAIALRLIKMNIDTRTWYLRQMLEATGSFVNILESST